MKKTIAILLVMVFALSCFALAGCGDSGNNSASSSGIYANSKYTGTWKAVRSEIGGKASNLDALFNGDYIVTLNADATAKVTDGDKVTDVKWAETSKGFTLKDNSNTEFTEDGDTVTAFVKGVKVFLEKQ